MLPGWGQGSLGEGNRRGTQEPSLEPMIRSHFLRSLSGPAGRWEIYSGNAEYKLKFLRTSEGTVPL